VSAPSSESEYGKDSYTACTLSLRFGALRVLMCSELRSCLSANGVERRSLVRVLVVAHDCRRPTRWLTAIAITTNNVTMPAMTTTRTIHAPTPN
jgi:hypothetical protein